MHFAVVGQPSLSAGAHTAELTFSLSEARTFREKVIYTASVSCGRSKYLQPIRPLVTTMARARALTLQRERDQRPHPAPLRRDPRLRPGDAHALLRPLSGSAGRAL